ncbi:MAG: TrmH family RNA methyltransferase [Filifactoraceae bacterium]
MIFIKSKDNEKIKYINQLITKKGREKYSSFLVEGEHGILQAIENNCNIKMLFISKDKENNNIYKEISEKSKEVYLVDDKLFDAISDTKNSQGIIAILDRVMYVFDDILKNGWDKILLVDRIQDPGNLGTIIRTTESAGYNCILLTKGTVDPFSLKVTRASVGVNTGIPIIFVSEEDVLLLKDNGYSILVTAINHESVNYNDVNYNKKHIIVMGNEANGVSDFFLKNSNYKIIIPIYGKTESLNVAVATGILLYKNN